MSIFSYLEGVDEGRDVVAGVIYENDYFKQARMILQKGSFIKEHYNGYPVMIAVVKGAIEFYIDDKVFKMKKGDIIPLQEKVKHSLKADEDSIVLVTFNKLMQLK